MSNISELELDIQTKLLRATFLTNMAVLRKHMPEIFEFYQNYSPTRAKLTFDHNGEVNMVSEGALVYEEKAKESSYKQAEIFVDKPKRFSYQIGFGGDDISFEHEHVLKKIYKRRETDIGVHLDISIPDNQIDFLTMIGVGLGFHIERLFQLCEVRFFYLFEPDPDCFFCALHCIDFGPLIDHCFSHGGAFTIKVGGNANQYVNGLNEMLIGQGFFNVSQFYNYRHYRSEATNETFQRIHELAYRLSSGWGFFEDEIISVIHTLGNAKEKFPYLIDKALFNNALSDAPVFIVGNGPSLDENIHFVKNNVGNAIVFSCGTALKPLLDAGIVPDFHVEMERGAGLYPWVDSVGHKDKLKQINIIALNTVFTDILKLFKNAYLLPKPKDGGMDFLYEFLNEDKYLPVNACNPTVSNAATAAAAYLGFKTMYLFGVDYGYIDETHHHSKGSIYYQKGSLAERDIMQGDMRVKGNFEEEVFTTQHFDNSRASLEILLEQESQVTCFNCSNGANIQLTKPMPYQDISPLTKVTNKQEEVDRLLSVAFTFEDLDAKNLERLFKRKLPIFKDVIAQVIKITSVNIQSRRELSQLFSTQYKYVRNFRHKKDTQVIYRFLQGTINYFQANIMSNVYFYQDKTEQKEYIKWSLDIFHQHLNWLFNELYTSYNKPSKW